MFPMPMGHCQRLESNHLPQSTVPSGGVGGGPLMGRGSEHSDSWLSILALFSQTYLAWVLWDYPNHPNPEIPTGIFEDLQEIQKPVKL